MNGIVLCHQGTEEIAALEVKEILKSKSKEGKGFVSFPIKKMEDLATLAYHGQGMKRVLLELGRFSFSDFKAYLEEVKKITLSDDVPRGSFRVTCERVGNHEFTSMEIEKETGNVLSTFFDSVSLKQYDVNIFVQIVDNACVIGVDFSGGLDSRSFHVMHSSAKLNSAVAYCALRFAGFNGKGVVVDPFCGSGTIPIEAALFGVGKSIHYYSKERLAYRKYIDKEIADKEKDFAGDVVAFDHMLKLVKYSQKNAKLAGIDKAIRFGRAGIDWLDTKLDKQSVDFVVTAPPFESVLTPRKDIEKVYKEFFYQAEFVLNDKGTVCIVTPKDEVLKEMLEHFVVAEEHVVWQGKQAMKILVLKKG